jgi:hypothetical protein
MRKFTDAVVSVVFGAWTVLIGGLISYGLGFAFFSLVPPEEPSSGSYLVLLEIILGAVLLFVIYGVGTLLYRLGAAVRKQINKIVEDRNGTCTDS